MFLKTILALGALCLSYNVMAADAPTPETPKPHFQSHFDKMDSNSDGKVSKQEFMSDSEARYTEVDTNHDSFISKDEWQVYRDKMRDLYRNRRDSAGH